MILIDKMGFTKDYKIQSDFDQKIKINLNLNDWIQKQIFYFGRYEIEKNETLFWQNIVKTGDIVFDVGANIGYYTMQTAARIGSNGRVYAFEPVSITYKKLIDNINLNNFKNIITENVAVSDTPGEIELYVADENSTGSSSIAMHVNFAGVKEKVKTIVLDEYIKDNHIPKLDLVKIDVEGCEPMVINGLKNTMNEYKPIILVEVLDERLNTINSSKEQLYELFNSCNYSGFEIIGDNSVRKIEKPIEGGLILFKHIGKELPQQIILV